LLELGIPDAPESAKAKERRKLARGGDVMGLDVKDELI